MDQIEGPIVGPLCADDAFSDFYTVAPGETLTVPYGAGLIQNDLLCGGTYTIDIVDDPQDGTVVEGPWPAEGSFEYTPDPGADVEDTFTYSLLESGVEVDQADVNIWIVDDCTVVASADGYSTPHETALTIPVPPAHGDQTLFH